ncbi:hydrolase [Caulobacter sp. CCUG 60055]|uniref:dienelactone hydrolase family protein n=1 Tax=Caulobacter sp. CCUG 60055 TaxID=2100090 RepID=UPI001FA7D7DD|nr:dienelactone hydrolase family protein [Caulobacter sp. CCUG 60055]MCI3179230.1 hydrolase [Caulobacter sp. CCUG 60055]
MPPSQSGVWIGPADLRGDLIAPKDPMGLVIFAHSGGSSRFNPRNRKIAFALAGRGMAVLLFDLLRPNEAAVRGAAFDVGLPTNRLVGAIDWARETPGLERLSIGLFGASVGAAAALRAAAQRPVAAVVSRGGRPDLAGPPRLATPTLLIVGSRDPQVLDLNRQAQGALGPSTRLAVIEGATHLFAERGAMDQVIALAADWFGQSFAAARAGEAGAGQVRPRPVVVRRQMTSM